MGVDGTVHQVLVYDGDQCVEWCHYGPPAELPDIKNPKGYVDALAELPDWQIGCTFTGKDHWREGVAWETVAGMLNAIKEACGGHAEDYPERVDGT